MSPDDVTTRRCPYCGRVMSKREAEEQGSCNDCYRGGGADEPR
jgi:ribosomal protein L37AE/L43A